ncbi:MAG TPA: SRPBCC family protein [Pyrinomonadaceae bacterium]|nr:SRPBCC family protein [Pyrinomonadaceae bacterium]
MSDYEFITVWQIDAPIADVWREIKDTTSWPEWWRGVIRVVELKQGDDDGLGSIHRSTWRSALPYTLKFDSEIIRIDEMRLIEARAFGELEGHGLWLFFANGNETRVQYNWTVKTTKKWMNLVAPLARPFFRWNHDTIMSWGEAGLKKRLKEPT